MADEFFTKKTCDRCYADLKVRIMSWFTEDTICLDCANKEDELKKKMRKKGKEPDMYEGCGYLPEV